MFSGSDGTLSGGNTYSYGSTGSQERALGSLLDGNVQPRYGVAYRNDTGQTIDTLSISYTVEQWRVAQTFQIDVLLFAASIDATSLTNGSWTGFDFVSSPAPSVAIGTTASAAEPTTVSPSTTSQ